MSETTVSPADARRLPKNTRSGERANFLASIIITAVEGGINYWASVSDYRWWDPTLDGGTAVHHDGIPNAYVTVHESERDDEDGYEGVLITVEHIARALGTLRQGPVTGLAESLRADIVAQDRANGEDETHQDIDAGLADCILQVAMFGTVVYG